MRDRRGNTGRKKRSWIRRQDDEFIEVDGICVLEGHTKQERELMLRYLVFYKGIANIFCFTEIEICTIAALGKMSNVFINEHKKIDKSHFAKDKNVVTVTTNDDDEDDPAEPSKKKFRCQVTAVIKSDEYKEGKTYSIKIFRTGVLHIPGIMRNDMKDVMVPLKSVCRLLTKATGKETIKVEYLTSIMRNYRCSLKRSELGISIPRLYRALLYEKSLPLYPIDNGIKLRELLIVAGFGQREIFMFFKLAKWNFMPICSPKLKENRKSGVLIRLERYMCDKRDLAINWVTSGKVTFNGSNSNVEAESSQSWTNYVILKYYDFIIYDDIRTPNEISDDEDFCIPHENSDDEE